MGNIKIRTGTGTFRHIPVSEISHTKYGNRIWTIYKMNNTFFSFKSHQLISGFNHLTKLWEK